MRYLMLTVIAISLMSCSLLPGDKDISANEVPSVVRNTLGSEYPNANDVEWEKHQDDFEAEFELDNVDYSVLINVSGDILNKKQEILLADLPEAVSNTVEQEYKDRKIEDPEKIEQDGMVYYQIELDGTFSNEEMVFTADGEAADAIAYWD